MRAVLDAGPLIHLSWIDGVDLLRGLFDEVIVPTAVRDEVLDAPPDTLGLSSIQRVLSGSWLEVRAPAQEPGNQLGPLGVGELEAIVLAAELDADLLLTDDALARAAAVQRGLRVAGTIGVLSQARDQGLIAAVLPLLQELKRRGQWISDELMRTVEEEERKR